MDLSHLLLLSLLLLLHLVVFLLHLHLCRLLQPIVHLLPSPPTLDIKRKCRLPLRLIHQQVQVLLLIKNNSYKNNNITRILLYFFYSFTTDRQTDRQTDNKATRVLLLRHLFKIYNVTLYIT